MINDKYILKRYLACEDSWFQVLPSTNTSVGSVQDLKTGSCWFDPPLGQYSLIDDSHCNRIHSSLAAVHCFDSGYMGKQPVAWEEFCAEYWLTHSHRMTPFDAHGKQAF